MPCGPDAPLAHMDDVSRGFENTLLKAGHLLDIALIPCTIAEPHLVPGKTHAAEVV